MDKLTEVSERVHAFFARQNEVRERAINLSRHLTRQCANAIRAVHRAEWDITAARLQDIRQAADEIIHLLADYPDLYYAGYTQDALKEYVEAFLTHALVRDEPLPTPEDLGVIPSTYINGLAEAATELRRSILDEIRRGNPQNAERLLDAMDAIYTSLITMDFPEAVTAGLRRRTDTVRSVLERTRGDLTMSISQQRLEKAVQELSGKLNHNIP
ncbi:MAG: haloacid dehalogenase [Anaerolineales bacterium]